MKAVFLITCAMSGYAVAESAIPAAYSRDRYQETFAASPFALATPKDDKPEETKDSPLNNLVVTGMGKLDDGRDFVVVQRIGDEGSMRFEGTEKNKEGLAVKEVKWGDRWGQSKVLMTYQAEQREVKFKDNPPPQVAAVAPAQPGRPVPGRPVPGVKPPSIVPTGLNSAARPNGVPKPTFNQNIPRPTNGVIVPRPGGAPGSFRGHSLNNTGAPNVPTNGGAPRQRIRTINNR
jgi:hypothetical protein